MLSQSYCLCVTTRYCPPDDGWSSSIVTGQAPPPCNHFTLTTVEGKRAAMFGGFSYLDDLYIVDLERHSVVSAVDTV